MNKNQETERGELTRFLDELQLLKKKDISLESSLPNNGMTTLE